MILKILVSSPKIKDGCSFYRAAGPFGKLVRDFSGQIQCTFVDRETLQSDSAWVLMQAHHILFLQKPQGAAWLDILETAKKFGLKTIVDYDDDLFAVNPDHPFYPGFSETKFKELNRLIAAHADQVWVSTQALKTRYVGMLGSKNLNIHVIPNCMDERWLWKNENDPLTWSEHEGIVWRGFQTHDEDLRSVAESWIDLAVKKQNLRFEFLGHYPHFICEHLQGRFSFEVIDNRAKYLSRLYRSTLKVGFHPLLENDFNRAKSNIAWLEFTAAGKAFIGNSRLPEFDEVPIVSYNGAMDFVEMYDLVSRNHERYVQESRALILEKFNLGRWNDKRMDLLTGL